MQVITVREKKFPLACAFFFIITKSLLIRLLWIKSLPNQSLKIIAKFCKDSQVEIELNKKILLLLGDHTNTNFSNDLHKSVDSIYSVLKQNMGGSMKDVGFPGRFGW